MSTLKLRFEGDEYTVESDDAAAAYRRLRRADSPSRLRLAIAAARRSLIDDLNLPAAAVDRMEDDHVIAAVAMITHRRVMP